MKKGIKILAVLAFPYLLSAQSAKVQTAWRALQDYESSKDVSSLEKAKENIDMACNHEDTKEKAKTWVYRAKIYYNLFKNKLEQEDKKLAATVPDKNERLTLAYGNVSTADYEESGKAMQKAMELDKDQTYQADMAMLGMQMMNDVNNLAVGKYNVGTNLEKAGKTTEAKAKYLEAIDFFEGSYMTSKAMGKKDTSSLTNCLVCAQRAKDNDKIKEYNQKIIDEKLATAYNYYNLYAVKMDMKDTAGAMKTLQEGLALFPNSEDLLRGQTETLLRQGKHQEAISVIDKVIEKNPKDAILFIVRGQLYYSLANPEDANKKPMAKPQNYDEIMGKSEADYKKAVELDPKGIEGYNNLGILYNNWSIDWQGRCDNLIKQATKLKECEAKTNEMLNKAVTAFEGALALNPNDKSLMKDLRRLYLQTNQPEKAQKMNDMIKK